MGIYKPTEFSANIFLDVYNGHIRTLDHVLHMRPAAFHVMMADLYFLARCVFECPIDHH